MKKTAVFGPIALAIIASAFLVHTYLCPVPEGKKGGNRTVEQYGVKGIDVSHYQGVINWDSVQDGNVSFCFIKATEGVGFVDARFAYNAKEAKKRDILVGAYHYYIFNKDNGLQFKNFTRTVDKGMIDLPVVVDVELRNNWVLHDAGSRDRFRDDVRGFLSMIESHYGRKPLIYTDINMYHYLLRGKIDNQLWIADFVSKRIVDLDSSQWLFWQYSHVGVKKGVKGKVDLNVFNGSLDDLKKLKATSTGRPSK